MDIDDLCKALEDGVKAYYTIYKSFLIETGGNVEQARELAKDFWESTQKSTTTKGKKGNGRKNSKHR